MILATISIFYRGFSPLAQATMENLQAEPDRYGVKATPAEMALKAPPASR